MNQGTVPDKKGAEPGSGHSKDIIGVESNISDHWSGHGETEDNTQ